MTPTTITPIADELLTVSQLRVRLHCRQSEVRPWLEAHHVPARKGPGRALLYRWGDVLDAMTPPAPPPKGRKSASGTLKRIPLR